MFRPSADDGTRAAWRDAVAPSLTLACLGASAIAIVLSPPDRVNSLSVIFGVAALGAGFLAVGEPGGRFGVSASFIVYVLAAAFLGPLSAAVSAVITELSASVRSKTPWRTAVFNNLAPAVLSAVVGAIIIR